MNEQEQRAAAVLQAAVAWSEAEEGLEFVRGWGKDEGDAPGDHYREHADAVAARDAALAELRAAVAAWRGGQGG